jgi:hypothetical protein
MKVFLCSVPSTESGVSEVEVIEYPTPQRELLTAIVVEDGETYSDKETVKYNKMEWIINNIISRFPQRRFTGLQRALAIIEEARAVKGAPFDGVMTAIQRVQAYGGAYNTWVNGLFAA